MAKIIELIYEDIQTRGAGKDGDPVRRIVNLYTKDGYLVATHDPFDSDKTNFDPKGLNNPL